jgi:site-specific DNA recombinase
MDMSGAVGYARVSTEDQAKENNSLPIQHNRISHYCEQNTLTLLKVFEDIESGRTRNRDGLQELISYCQQRRTTVSHVVVAALSRLARKVEDQAYIMALLNKLGIRVVSLDEPTTDDSAIGQLVRNMVGSFNQFFSDSLSESTKGRMQARVKAGRFLWPDPIGYTNLNKRLHLDPVRAPLVRQAFELIATGRYVTTHSVLKVVTALGLTTKKGYPVSKQTFSRMLVNPVYSGWVVSGELKERGSHEPIVS